MFDSRIIVFIHTMIMLVKLGLAEVHNIAYANGLCTFGENQILF